MSGKTVWMIDFDGKIENLALMRLSAYHKSQGDTVLLKRGYALPEMFDALPDKVYISTLFRWNRQRAIILAHEFQCEAVIGGTGYNVRSRLPLEVERMDPDYSLYGKDRAIGFISRGCPNACPYCVVPEKEGKLCRVSTAEKIVGSRKEALFLDNNFLELPDHVSDLLWLAENGVSVDFNQGLDARLVNSENARALADVKWSAGPRFACDSMAQIPHIGNAFKTLEARGIPASQLFAYCLIGFNGIGSDIDRLMYLRGWKCSVFPMGYRDLETGSEPARGWNRKLYTKYRRLICKMPRSAKVWEGFKREVVGGVTQ